VALVDSLLLVTRVLAKLALRFEEREILMNFIFLQSEIFQLEHFKKLLPLNVNSFIVFNIFNKSKSRDKLKLKKF
jgi:hypothetical protein